MHHKRPPEQPGGRLYWGGICEEPLMVPVSALRCNAADDTIVKVCIAVFVV